MDNWKELIQDFLDEAYTLIDNLEESLLDLEKDLSDKSGINTIFRVAHTIKGGAGAVGFDDVTKLTHIMEDVLDLVRNNKYTFTPDDISLLLEVHDELKLLLKAHENQTIHPFDKTSALIRSLEQIKEKAVDPKSEKEPPSISDDSFDFSIDTLPIAARFAITNDMMAGIEESFESHEKLLFIEIRFNQEYEMKEVAPFELLNMINAFAEPIIMNPSVENLDAEYYPYLNVVISSSEDAKYIENKLFISDVVSKVTIEVLDKELLLSLQKNMQQPIQDLQPENTPPQEKIPQKQEIPQHPLKEEEKRSPTLKVESSRVDDVLNLLGELVIIRSGISQFGVDLEQEVQKLRNNLRNFLSSSNLLPLNNDVEQNKLQNEEFRHSFENINKNLEYYSEYSQQLSRISSTLQMRMMQLRMVPIQTVFSRFTRLTRDIAKQLHKNIELIIEGGETEIDKSIIDDLYDPLMHMIRNSLDHGIEKPEVRKQAGKNETGIIKLSAYQEGDAIFIEIQDDGKGIDSEKIKEKAIEKQFITAEKAATMSEQEALSLILMPGFSTAEQISNLSGRGVGMDVVHRKIEELGGSVNIFSELGKGSTIKIQLPLTLAIIQGLLTVVGKIHYIIPIASVEETVILEAERLHKLNHYYAIEFREKLIPLISLPSVLYNINIFESMNIKHQNPNHSISKETDSQENIIKDNELNATSSSENTQDSSSSVLENINAELEKESSYASANYCIIIRYGERQVGFIVPEILGEQDIVIKPLDRKLIASPGIAAATIVGNGEIGFILDIREIIRFYLKKQQ